MAVMNRCKLTPCRRGGGSFSTRGIFISGQPGNMVLNFEKSMDESIHGRVIDRAGRERAGERERKRERERASKPASAGENERE